MNDNLLLLQILKTHYVNNLSFNLPEVEALREARPIDFEVTISSENLIFRISLIVDVTQHNLKFKYISLFSRRVRAPR